MLILVGTGTLAVICSSGCTQNNSSKKEVTQFVKASAEATQLVTISEIHAIFAQSYAAGYRDQALKQAAPEKEVTCVTTQITPDLVLPLLANTLDMKCSDDELRQAISFYESATGKTYIRYEQMRVNAMFGASTEEPPAYSSTEEDGIAAFEQTCVGKLVTSQDPSLRAAMKEAMRPKLFAIFEQCKNAQ